MREIPLTQGKVAIVDDEDYEKLSQYKWRYMRVYAYTGIEGIAMHRMILNAPKGMTVDHINGDGLDNRRANIRLATQKENCRNRGKRADNKSSNFKGVYTRGNGRWMVMIDNKYLGTYKSELAAANCYNYHARERHGDFAKLNQVEFMDYGLWDMEHL